MVDASSINKTLLIPNVQSHFNQVEVNKKIQVNLPSDQHQCSHPLLAGNFYFAQFLIH